MNAGWNWRNAWSMLGEWELNGIHFDRDSLLWIKNSVPATHDNDILWRKNRVPLTDKSCFFFVGLKLSHAVEDVPDVPARHMQMPCTKPIMGSCSPTTADSRRWGAAGGGSSFPRFSKSWSPQNFKKMTWYRWGSLRVTIPNDAGTLQVGDLLPATPAVWWLDYGGYSL